MSELIERLGAATLKHPSSYQLLLHTCIKSCMVLGHRSSMSCDLASLS